MFLGEAGLAVAAAERVCCMLPVGLRAHVQAISGVWGQQSAGRGTRAAGWAAGSNAEEDCLGRAGAPPWSASHAVVCNKGAVAHASWECGSALVALGSSAVLH